MSQYKMTGADGQSYLGLPVTMNSEKFPGQMNNVHLRDYAKNDLDDFYRTGVTTNNSIALSGGTDKMSSYFSYGNSHSDGMLPKNKLRAVRMRKLKVYTGSTHPHQAQQPRPLPETL